MVCSIANMECESPCRGQRTQSPPGIHSQIPKTGRIARENHMHGRAAFHDARQIPAKIAALARKSRGYC